MTVGNFITGLLSAVSSLPSIVFTDEFYYLFGAIISFGILVKLVRVSVGL